MKSKKTVYIFFLFIIINFLIICAIVYVNDPLQVFHKHWIRKKNVLMPDMRMQAAGIINHHEFDSIIIGTSMLENTSSIEASKKLGGNFINISLDGSDFYERSFVIRYAIEKKKIKKVLFSLDSGGLVLYQKNLQEDTSYLYDKSRSNDYKAYLNINNLKYLIKFTSSGHHSSLDCPNAWYDNPSNTKRYGGLYNWFEAKNSAQIKKAFKEISDVAKKVKMGEVAQRPRDFQKRVGMARKYIDTYVLYFAESHPETEFVLILPPYSRLNYAMQAQYYKDDFKIYKIMVRYLVLKSKDYPNIKVFGWGNYPFVDNIANYKDPSHYEYKINSWMLSAIMQDEGLLLTDNVDKYLNIFTEKSLKFDLIGFGKKLDDYLNNRYLD